MTLDPAPPAVEPPAALVACAGLLREKRIADAAQAMAEAAEGTRWLMTEDGLRAQIAEAAGEPPAMRVPLFE